MSGGFDTGHSTDPGKEKVISVGTGFKPLLGTERGRDTPTTTPSRAGREE